jgi:hypothetical protein
MMCVYIAGMIYVRNTKSPNCVCGYALQGGVGKSQSAGTGSSLSVLGPFLSLDFGSFYTVL